MWWSHSVCGAVVSKNSSGCGGSVNRKRIGILILSGLVVSLGLVLYFFRTGDPGLTDPLRYDPQFVESLTQEALQFGNVQDGALLFASERLACLTCHKVGDTGGEVGPVLTRIGQERTPQQIVESLFWPQRDVPPEYVSWTVATVHGQVWTGFKRNETAESFQLVQPAVNSSVTVLRRDIDHEAAIGTVMPEGILAILSAEERRDLIRFVTELGRTGEADQAAKSLVTSPVPSGVDVDGHPAPN